ncbi:MAG: SAM-dependent methyltransferase [Pseudomonadota bacterium]
MTGKLYLVPTPISPGDIAWVLPQLAQHRVAEIEYFIVEHPKTARQFLKKINTQRALQTLQLQELNEHTHRNDLFSLLDPLFSGHDVGLLSEAGCPAIADPGAELIRLAHQNNISVIPLVGPSSVSLALMASGLNGQCFAFHGYLPIDSAAQVEKILLLEKQSIQHDQTQIFIETPYRNKKLLEQLIKVCAEKTHLCIASHMTADNEMIATRTIREWRQSLPDIHKIPTIFLLHG